jgi:hypothetical protein
MTRRWVFGATVLVIAMTGVAWAKIVSCPAGRFEMRDAGPGGGPTLTGTFLHLSDEGMVAVEGMCDATPAARRFSSFWHGPFSAKGNACVCVCTEVGATPDARCGIAGPPSYGCECSLDG